MDKYIAIVTYELQEAEIKGFIQKLPTKKMTSINVEKKKNRQNCQIFLTMKINSCFWLERMF